MKTVQKIIMLNNSGNYEEEKSVGEVGITVDNGSLKEGGRKIWSEGVNN